MSFKINVTILSILVHLLVLTTTTTSSSSTTSTSEPESEVCSATQFASDGTVLELDESNFDSAISCFDNILVDFYAPWCGHCNRLASELDAAAPVLARLKDPIRLAKVNADKLKRLGHKYDVHAYPTLKLFMHGLPVVYKGPRKAELLVQYLKKFVAPDVSVLDSDSSISNFIESAGTDFPIYIGCGLNESVILKSAIKYKKRAWFSVAKDFSQEVMNFYSLEKVPALVSFNSRYKETSVFYGPFEEEFLDIFIKQNLLPLAMPINYDTLKLLRDDDRKVVLAIVEDDTIESSLKLLKLLKAAASTNRNLVFCYVGVRQMGDFANLFGDNRKTQLPKLIIWNGNEEFASVIGSERISGDDYESQISQLIKGYREGSVRYRKIGGPSTIDYMKSLIGSRVVYSIIFVIFVIVLIRTIFKEEPLTVGRRDPLAADARKED